MDSAIHWINHYPLDNSVGFGSVYPLDSDLSSPVVLKVDNAIYWTNHYTLESAASSTITFHWIVIYLADSTIHDLNN